MWQNNTEQKKCQLRGSSGSLLGSTLQLTQFIWKLVQEGNILSYPTGTWEKKYQFSFWPKQNAWKLRLIFCNTNKIPSGIRNFLKFVIWINSSCVSHSHCSLLSPSMLKSSYKELTDWHCQIVTSFWHHLLRQSWIAHFLGCTMLGSFSSSNSTKFQYQQTALRLQKGQGSFLWVTIFLVSVAYCQNTSDTTDLVIFLTWSGIKKYHTSHKKEWWAFRRRLT